MSYRPTRSLVTGASSGIGAAFARALAARGSDLVLVARRTDRLRALAAELEAAHGIRAEVITADLAKPAAGRALRAKIGGDVDTVVNNAGFGDHDPLVDADPEVLERMIAVDVAALVDITRAFLPAMVERGHGRSSTSPARRRSRRCPSWPRTARRRRSSSVSARRCGRRRSRTA
jgi:short-subunit dehydrogenase